MATSTERFGFTKPAGSDPASVVPLNSNIDLIELYLGRTQDSIAPLYDDTETYSVGDLRTYESRLYKCNTDILTPETFDPEKWDLTTAVQEGGGGGSGASAIEKTQAEYDALTPAQKTNGSIYMVQSEIGEEKDLTERMSDYTSSSGTVSAYNSKNANFLAWHALASEDSFDASVNGEYWAGNGDGAYLQFDFTNPVMILKIGFASYLASNFKIMYSTDGNEYIYAQNVTREAQSGYICTKTDTTLDSPIRDCVSIRLVCDGAEYNVGALHFYGYDSVESVNKIYYMGTEYANTNGGSGGGGESDIIEYEYATFDGTDYFITPFNIDADHQVEVTFQTEYFSPSSVYGNIASASYSHLTIYQNTYYTSIGDGETSFGTFSNAKHTFKSNVNGKNVMDDVEVTNYTPSSHSTPYVIGYRINSGYFKGKLYNFKIKSINTENVLYDLVPAVKDSVAGLYDRITEIFTPCEYIAVGGESSKVKPFARDINYDNTTSQLSADNVQEAIDEVVANANTASEDILTLQNVQGYDEYDETQTYAVGDYAIYNNIVYECTTAVSTAEPFDSTKWTATSIEQIIDGVKGDISQLNSSLTAITTYTGNQMSSSYGTFDYTYSSVVYNDYMATVNVRFTPNQNITAYSFIYTLPDGVKPVRGLTIPMGESTNFRGMMRLQNDGRLRTEIALTNGTVYEFTVSFIRARN